jgi:uncharacterized protein
MNLVQIFFKKTIDLHLKMKEFLSIVFILASLNFGSAYSFECNLAKTRSEILICSDPYLKNLDEAMNKNYKFMINSNIGEGARKNIYDTQKVWLLDRDKCQDSACIVEAYKKRIGDVCDYPVIYGVHPICINFNEISKNKSNKIKGE